MAHLDQLRRPENLERAWRWIRSNGDASYKSYFRPLYQRYAVADTLLIEDLSERLKRGIYEPEKSTKCFHPKKSGILRPFSLLSVEDQIVYQAAVNLIAEKLQPKVVKRYNKQVFGHLYAGKPSVWFYRKWSDGYAAFNKAAREAFDEGYVYTASFDLTACYDSLDHRVLRHFLEKLGFDPDFCDKLGEWLERWTATEREIYHHHGIPQGPLSSGLLSEVVLSHFDDLKLKGVDFKYFRYVDDIRLFARNEKDLRRLLVSLDLLSKDVGLFPQSGKIGIHQVTDIESELKSISNPPETIGRNPFIDQKKLLKRIVELTPRYQIENPTRFKYLLGQAIPSAQLTDRLWRVLEGNPDVFRNVCNYLRRYQKMPKRVAENVIYLVRTNDLYNAVRSSFIEVADERLPEDQERELIKFIKKLWKPKTMDPELFVSAGRFLIRTGELTPRQISQACRTAPSWWARATILDAVDSTALGESTIQKIVAAGLKDKSRDVAISAAWKGLENRYVPKGSRKNWNKAGELVLKDIGMIGRSVAGHCGISSSFARLDKGFTNLDWKKLFESNYKNAERQSIELVSASGTNITNFVNLLDVFDDWLLGALFAKDGSIGGYTFGNIGSALGSPTCRFAIAYPATFELAKEVHSLRLESMASHPMNRRTGKPTKRISYKVLPKIKKWLKAAFAEIESKNLV